MMTKFCLQKQISRHLEKHVRRSKQQQRQQQQQQQASRHGGQQTVASNMAAGKVGADKGGNRSTRVTEHVGEEWRRRQSFEGRMELEGADSVGEIGAGRNCRKQVRFGGKCLKQVFDELF